jgi:hypothetical protein
MGLLEKIYDNSPIFFQNIMASVSGYKRIGIDMVKSTMTI